MSTPSQHPDLSGSGLGAAQVWHHYRRYPFLLSRLILFAVVVALVWLVLHTIESVLFPVLVSLLLAYVLDPVIDRFEERGWARTTSILAFLVLGAVGALVFLLFLYPTIAHLIGSVVEKFPRLLDAVRSDLIPWVERTTGQSLPASFGAVMDQYGATLKAQLPAMAERVSTWVVGLWSSGGAAVASLLNVVLVPVLTFYFLRDFDKLKEQAAEFIPIPQRAFVLSRLGRADEVVGAWIRGQIEVALLLGVLYAIGLGVVFWWMGVGVITGVAVGMTAGLLNFIPYLGFLIGAVLSFAIVLIDWAGPGPLFATIAVFAVVQALEGWVITPRIVGEKVGMSPVSIILLLLVGGEVLGLLGVVLAIPVAGALGVLLPDIVAWYRSTNFFTGELDGVPAPAQSDATVAEE